MTVSSKGSDKEQGKDMSKALEEAGIDMTVGLRYCEEDKEFYLSMLAEFCSDADEKISRLNEYFDSEDWQNYSMVLHSVKSTSRTIGALEMSDIAAELEKAALSGDDKLIRSTHSSMITGYSALCWAIDGIITSPEENGL